MAGVHPPGRLLASGRDSDIFDYGPGLVLRRSRRARSMAFEAQVMEYLRGRGYPVPAVDHLSEDGCDLVMERVDGPSMVGRLMAKPWTVRRQGAVLADLHTRLHEIEAPSFLNPALVGAGESIVHMDLHPLNVIIGPKGPVVIDWTGASRGDPAIDVALAWVLMAAGEISEGGLKTRAMGVFRGLLVNSFLARFDRHTIVSRLRAAVEWKVHDPHMSDKEQQAMWRVVSEAGG